MSRWGAWRFIHPDLDQRSGPPGLRLTNTGSIAMVQDAAAVRQAVLLLLSTQIGERVMRPDYGCELSSLVFNPNDDTTAGLAIHYVRRALETWEPRIELLSVDATRSAEDAHRLDVWMEYRVRATGRKEHLSLGMLLVEGAP